MSPNGNAGRDAMAPPAASGAVSVAACTSTRTARSSPALSVKRKTVENSVAASTLRPASMETTMPPGANAADCCAYLTMYRDSTNR